MAEALTVKEAVINQIATDVYSMAADKGFWAAPDPYLAEISAKLMLIVTEVSEAMEALRAEYHDSRVNPYTRMTDQQSDDFLEEIADVVIRSFDLMRHLTSDPAAIITAKMERNARRPALHGKRF